MRLGANGIDISATSKVPTMSETIHPKRDLDVPWVAVPDPLDAQARHDALEALSGADQGASAAQAALRARADPLGVTPTSGHRTFAARCAAIR